MEYTDILALKKPGDSDNALIGDINENMDALERGIYKRRAVCSSGAATVAKTAACEGFILADGVIVAVEFANKNTKAGFTLNINGTGAKAVYYNGAAVDGKALPKQALLYYDGTRYNLISSDPDALTPEKIGAAATVHEHVDTQVTVTSETAQKVWPKENERPESPNVDQALSELADTFKVGDIKTTVRTDLGDDWLLCNGESGSSADYPELSPLLPPAFTSANGFTNFSVSNINNYTITGAVYGNGYWVIVTGSGAYYSTDIESDSWTSIPDLQGVYFMGIYFLNGYFCAANSSGKLYYTTDPTGAWNSSYPVNTNYNVYGMAYGDGYWAAVFSDRVCYTTDLATWTEAKRIGNYGSSVYITYGDGEWLITQAGSDYKIGWYAIGAPTSFMQRSFPEDMVIPTYQNGIFLAKHGEVAFYYSSSAQGDFVSTGSTSSAGTLRKPVYIDGYWMQAGNGKFAYLKAEGAPIGEWTYFSITNNPLMAVGDGRIAIFDTSPSKGGKILRLSDFAVPTITTEGAYNYIKGR